uniref:RRM domain-containing protein n=1 Tax=Steinernema glaseri TaxID=37863 RepID=A0A1I7ZP06_9BILA
MLYTYDPTLTSLGLPAYPPLPADTELGKVEEIRRTIYVGNIPKESSGEEVLNFFNTFVGEVMYVRMAAGNDSLPCAYAYVEFTEQSSIPLALQNDGIEFEGNSLRIQHSKVAILKPQRKTDDQALAEVNEAIKNQKEEKNAPLASTRRGLSPSTRRRSRSRSPVRTAKRRSRSRERERRERDKERERERERERESSRRERDRSRERRRDRERSRERDRERDRERERDRNRSGSRERDRDRRDRDRKKDKDRKDRRRSRSRDKKERKDKERDRERDRDRRDRKEKDEKDRKRRNDDSEDEEALRERLLATKREREETYEKAGGTCAIE